LRIHESVAHYWILIFGKHENSITTNAPKKNLSLTSRTQATLRQRSILLHFAPHNYKDPPSAPMMNEEDEQWQKTSTTVPLFNLWDAGRKT